MIIKREFLTLFFIYSIMKNLKKFKDFTKKRKRTVIKKVTDASYSWKPTFDKNSPQPASNYQINITPVKL